MKVGSDTWFNYKRLEALDGICVNYHGTDQKKGGYEGIIRKILMILAPEHQRLLYPAEVVPMGCRFLRAVLKTLRDSKGRRELQDPQELDAFLIKMERKLRHSLAKSTTLSERERNWLMRAYEEGLSTIFYSAENVRRDLDAAFAEPLDPALSSERVRQKNRILEDLGPFDDHNRALVNDLFDSFFREGLVLANAVQPDQFLLTGNDFLRLFSKQEAGMLTHQARQALLSIEAAPDAVYRPLYWITRTMVPGIVEIGPWLKRYPSLPAAICSFLATRPPESNQSEYQRWGARLQAFLLPLMDQVEMMIKVAGRYLRNLHPEDIVVTRMDLDRPTLTKLQLNQILVRNPSQVSREDEDMEAEHLNNLRENFHENLIVEV